MTLYLTKADVLAIAEEVLPSVGLRDGLATLIRFRLSSRAGDGA